MDEKSSLFTKMPQGHEKYDQEDSSKCPFFMSQRNNKDIKKDNNLGLGGCPMMQMDESKRNPAL